MRTRDRKLLAAAVAAIVTAGVAMWPTTRYIGVDHVISEESVPLWLKVMDFVDRDSNLSRIAERVVGAVEGDETRALAAARWTHTNIRPQPDELPVRDDHVWFVVVRGYGEPDQQADVFTTLLAYKGIAAFWGLVGRAPDELPLSYAQIDGMWRVFDVAHGLVFRRTDGALASPADLARDRGIVERAARGVVPDLPRYMRSFDGYGPPETPDVLRADMHMPGRRLLHEMKALVGMQGRVWQIRPHPVVTAQGATR